MSSKKKSMARLPSLALLLAVVLSTSGCRNIFYPVTGGTTGGGPYPLTGNWQVAVTTPSGTAPFSALAGSIVQEANLSTGSAPVNSILQALTPSSCYIGEPVLPLQGSLAGTKLSLTSFSVSGQNLVATLTTSDNADAFVGTYLIEGGCANGTTGTLSGTMILPMTGSYTGTTTGTATTITIASTQDTNADGLGSFHVQGTATFTGSPCFTSATLQYSTSTVTGEQVNLSMTGNDSSNISAVGTLASTGDTIILTSIQVLSGSCAGSLGTATLNR
jgi:hypothetical protein